MDLKTIDKNKHRKKMLYNLLTQPAAAAAAVAAAGVVAAVAAVAASTAAATVQPSISRLYLINFLNK